LKALLKTRQPTLLLQAGGHSQPLLLCLSSSSSFAAVLLLLRSETCAVMTTARILWRLMPLLDLHSPQQMQV